MQAPSLDGLARCAKLSPMTLERDHLRQKLAVLKNEHRRARASLAGGDHIAAVNASISISKTERDIEEVERRLLQIEDREREEASAVATQAHLDLRRAEREEAAFWFRRFFTTLGIANAAAFAALAGGLLQADDPIKLAPVAGPAMDAFIWGAIWAGSIPLLLWVRLALRPLEDRWDHDSPKRRLLTGAQVLSRQLVALFAATSTIMFCIGLFTAAGAVHGLAEGKKVADARVAAANKSRVHAPPAAR